MGTKAVTPQDHLATGAALSCSIFIHRCSDEGGLANVGVQT